MVGGHETVVSGVTPARSSARLLTALNVEPGAYCPYVARFCPPLPGPLAAARIAPSLGRIATIALAGPTPASSRSASVWRRGFMVSASGLPGAASELNSSFAVPSSSIDWTSTPDVPRSCSSYLACRPERPAWSPIS